MIIRIIVIKWKVIIDKAFLLSHIHKNNQQLLQKELALNRTWVNKIEWKS